MANVTKLSTVPRPRSTRSARRRSESPSVVPLVPARLGPAEIPVGPDGLPRRIRQRGPARQSRRPVTAEPAPRTPEQVRTAMAALQAGTDRGRRGTAYPTPPASGVDAPTVPTVPVVSAGPTADEPTTELPRVRPGEATDETVTGTGRDG
jgi:hypothetical protein